jgi:hypothetical protein
MNKSEIDSYKAKCVAKINGLKAQLNDELTRDCLKADLKAKISYWEDEYWLAVEEQLKLDEQSFLDKGFGYSNNN